MALRSATRRLVAVAAAGAVALAAVPEPAVADATVRGIAAALRTDPVYVADSQSRLLTVPQRGRVRLRIVRKDIGRIQIAVVSPEGAQRAGGIGGLANAIDQAMPGRRGALVATTGSAFHVVTSHGVVEPVVAISAPRRPGIAWSIAFASPPIPPARWALSGDTTAIWMRPMSFRTIRRRTRPRCGTVSSRLWESAT